MTTVTCPCGCRPDGSFCGEPMAGIELIYGQCILCEQGEHWQEGDDEPAFDWPAILMAASREGSTGES